MEIERGGQHHSLPDQHQDLQQPRGGRAEEALPHSELSVDVAQLLGDDERGEGEEEAVTRDVQSSPPEASLVAALPGEVNTDRTHSGQLLYPGEQDLGKGIPDTGPRQQTSPDIAGGSSQQFSLER